MRATVKGAEKSYYGIICYIYGIMVLYCLTSKNFYPTLAGHFWSKAFYRMDNNPSLCKIET